MKTPTEVSNAILEPSARIASGVPGGLTAIAAELSKSTGESYSRAEVHRWLNPVAEKRVEPKLGIAMLLMAAAERVLAKHDRTQAERSAKRQIVAMRRTGVGRVLRKGDL